MEIFGLKGSGVTFPSLSARLQFCYFLSIFLLALHLSLCLYVCVCVSVHTCTQTYGSHVLPYKDWVWEELMRNEQNYGTGTPLFLSVFFCGLSCTCLQHVSMFKVLLNIYTYIFLFILYFFKSIFMFFKKKSLCIDCFGSNPSLQIYTVQIERSSRFSIWQSSV